MLKYLVLLFILFLSPLSFANEAKVVANVGGKVITTRDINERMKLLTSLGQLNNRDNPANIALNQLIDEQLYKKSSIKHKIKLTDTELNNSYKAISNSLGYKDIETFCKQNGLSLAHLKEHILNQNLWQKIILHIIQPQIELTESDYLTLIKDPRLIELDFKLGIVENSSDEIKKATAKVKNCNDFSKAIKKLSNREVENYTKVVLADLTTELHNALVNLNQGDINIFAHDNTHEVVMLCNKRPYFPEEKLKKEMRMQLENIKISIKAKQTLDKLKRETFIQIFN